MPAASHPRMPAPWAALTLLPEMPSNLTRLRRWSLRWRRCFLAEQPLVTRLPESIQEKAAAERKQDQGHEKAVYRERGRREHDHPARENPRHARQRYQSEHQRKHKDYRTQATSSFSSSSFLQNLFRALRSRTCVQCDG